MKVLTAVDMPTSPEGLLLVDLRGNYQVVNLTEIAQFSNEERRDENGILYDLQNLD